MSMRKMKEFDIIFNTSPPGSLHLVHCPLLEKRSSVGFDRVRHCAMTHADKLLTLVLDSSNAVEAGKYEHTMCEIQEQPDTSVSSYVAVCRNNEIHLSEITRSHQIYPSVGVQSHKNSQTFQSFCDDTTTAKVMVPRVGGSQENESWRRINFSPSCTSNSFIHDLFFAPVLQKRNAHLTAEVWKSVLPPIQWSKFSLRKAIAHAPMIHQVYKIMHELQVLSMADVAILLNWLESDNQRDSVEPLSVHLQDALIDSLRQCSVYIHGFWVCKAACEPLSMKLQYVREFILLIFFRSGVHGLTRAKLAENLPVVRQSDILTILNSLSTLDPVTKNWHLKDLCLSKNSVGSEVLSVPESVVHEEKIAWIQREPFIDRNIKLMTTDNSKHESSLTMTWRPSTKAALKNEEATNATENKELKKTLTTKQREDVKVYIRDLYGIHGVIHGSRLMPLIREEKRKPTSRLRSLTEAQIFEALKPLLIMLNKDKATAIRSWDYAELDMYRNLIIEILQRGNASRDMISREINDRTLVPISDQTFRSIINELARFNVNEGMWSFKSGLDM